MFFARFSNCSRISQRVFLDINTNSNLNFDTIFWHVATAMLQAKPHCRYHTAKNQLTMFQQTYCLKGFSFIPCGGHIERVVCYKTVALLATGYRDMLKKSEELGVSVTAGREIGPAGIETSGSPDHFKIYILVKWFAYYSVTILYFLCGWICIITTSSESVPSQ